MSKIEKIIFLHEHQFGEYYYQSFGIQTLESFGYDVEVWNYSPFIQNDAYLKDHAPCTFHCDNHHSFNTKNDAVEAILNLPATTFIISGVHLTPNTLSIYRALAKKKILCASLLAMALPLGTFPKKQALQKKFRILSWPRVREKLFSMIPFKHMGVHPVNMIFAMGEKYLRSGYPADIRSEIVWTHSFDFDHYLQERNLPCILKPDMGIFLDEYLPYHSDNTAAGLPHVPAEKYYSRLRKFFEHLESQFSVKIVIAAHPRSHYDDKPGIFGNREVIRGETSALVRQSGFVILHQSMAMNFAVLYRKPMVFVITDDAERYLIEDPYPQWLADTFGKRLHNLDDDFTINLPEELKINENAYQSFQNDYIKKKDSPDLPFWEIVADRIGKIN